MDDVVGEVMLTIGDENLGADDPIAAVAGALGLGAQRADIGAGLRLGELHRAHPFAGHQLGQVGLLQIRAAVRSERIDRRHGEQRRDGERHRGRIPHLGAGGVDGARQALAAPFAGRGKPVPPGRGPGPGGLLPARRHGDAAVIEGRAEPVANRVERRDRLAREAAGRLENGLKVVIAEIVKPVALRLREPRRMLEAEKNVGNRRPIGHGFVPRPVQTGPQGKRKSAAAATPGRLVQGSATGHL